MKLVGGVPLPIRVCNRGRSHMTCRADKAACHSAAVEGHIVITRQGFSYALNGKKTSCWSQHDKQGLTVDFEQVYAPTRNHLGLCLLRPRSV